MISDSVKYKESRTQRKHLTLEHRATKHGVVRSQNFASDTSPSPDVACYRYIAHELYMKTRKNLQVLSNLDLANKNFHGDPEKSNVESQILS